MAAFLALAPTALALALARRWRALAAGLALAVAIAEVGRRRAGGRAHFPATASLCAPLWLAERAVCAWLAALARAHGGVRYGERRIRLAANPVRALRRRRP